MAQASKAMARIDRLVHYGWKPTMAEYMALREADQLGFKVRVVCYDSPKETGRFSDPHPTDDRVRYGVSIASPAKLTREQLALKNTLNRLSASGDIRGQGTRAWWTHALVRSTILDEPEEKRITGITVTRENPTSVVDTWWVTPPRGVSRKIREIDHALTPFLDLAFVGAVVVGAVATDRWIRRKAGVRQ